MQVIEKYVFSGAGASALGLSSLTRLVFNRMSTKI